MKKTLLSLALCLFAGATFAQEATPLAAGTYTVGGDGANYATLRAACDAINANGIAGNVTLAIAADLEEPTNVGLQNTSTEYSVTIAPASAKEYKITFTQIEDNAGPSGNLCLGIDGTLKHEAGATASHNMFVDGSFENDGKQWLTFENVVGANRYHGVILIYGNVKNSAVRNTKLIALNNDGNKSNYAIELRTETKAATHLTPTNIVIENNYLQNTSGKTGQGITLRGAAAPFPTNVSILNNEIVAATRGVFLQGVTDGMTIDGNTFRIQQTADGYESAGIYGYTDVNGTINVRNNKFVELSTAAVTADKGIYAIWIGNVSADWYIENNYITGFKATAETIEENLRFRGIAPSPYTSGKIYVRHNTILLNELANLPAATALGSVYAIRTDKLTEVSNNLLVSDNTAFPHAFLTAADGTKCKNNVYSADQTSKNVYFAEDKQAWADFSAVETTAAFVETVLFADAAKGDLSLAGASDGDSKLAVPAIAEVTKDINGKTRHADKVYAGAFEGSDFAGGSTGLENAVEQKAEVRKVIENGMLVIIKDGVRYNVLGNVIE